MQFRMAHMHDNLLNGCDVIMLAHPIRGTQPASELAHRTSGVCAIIQSGISGGTCRQQDSMASCCGIRRKSCWCCRQPAKQRGLAPSWAIMTGRLLTWSLRQTRSEAQLSAPGHQPAGAGVHVHLLQQEPAEKGASTQAAKTRSQACATGGSRRRCWDGAPASTARFSGHAERMLRGSRG